MDVLHHSLNSSPHSYQEDFQYENGQYMSYCCICGEVFLGHKRRMVCKLCHTAKPIRKGDNNG